MPRRKLTELSLFSGAGGGLLGTKILGWQTIGYVEKDKYCQNVLRARIRDGFLDDAPIFSDIRTFDGLQYRERVDIITAGFPCQPFSVAGRRKGSNDDRNMWPDTIRVIREVNPRMAFLENVPGLLGKHGYFGTVLGDLAETGYDARWCCISASDAGAPHRRNRLWILAYANGSRQSQPEGHVEKQRRWARDCSQNVADADRERRNRGTGIVGETRGGESKNGRRWYPEPDLGRVAYGVASRVDRLRALGNGQVPRVVVEAWERLTGLNDAA
jgi:DNA (cytosine-5)-methyltransferase 1